MEKLGRGTATAEERGEFWQIHGQKALEVLQKPLETLFIVQPVTRELPPKAHMEPSRACARCGEPTMCSKLVSCKGQEICRDCLAAAEG